MQQHGLSSIMMALITSDCGMQVLVFDKAQGTAQVVLRSATHRLTVTARRARSAENGGEKTRDLR